MCRVAVTTFEYEPSSVAAARRWARGVLADWLLDHVADTTVLLLSEAVTNALVHTASRPTVRLAITRGVLEVDVDDDEPRLPDRDRLRACWRGTAGAGVLLTDGGRGLLLIDALADAWGATARNGGKQVWFRLDIDDWPYRGDCACDDETRGVVILGSGLHARHMPGSWQFDTD